LMQSGDMDKAQKIFRRILEIDPTREDLKHSLEKTRSEKFEEIDSQNARRELIRNSIYIALIIATFAGLLLGGVFWHNHKQLNTTARIVINYLVHMTSIVRYLFSAVEVWQGFLSYDISGHSGCVVDNTQSVRLSADRADFGLVTTAAVP